MTIKFVEGSFHIIIESPEYDKELRTSGGQTFKIKVLARSCCL